MASKKETLKGLRREDEADALLASLPEPTEKQLLFRAFSGKAYPMYWRQDKRRKDKGLLECHCSACGADYDLRKSDGEPAKCPKCGARIKPTPRPEAEWDGERENLALFQTAGGWQFVRFYNCKREHGTRKGATEGESAALVWVYCFPPEGEMLFLRRGTTWANYQWDMKRDGPLAWRPFERRFSFDWLMVGEPELSERFRWLRPKEGLGYLLPFYMEAVSKPHDPMLETLSERGAFGLLGDFLLGGRSISDPKYRTAVKIALSENWAVGGEWLDDIDEAEEHGRSVCTSRERLEPTRLAALVGRINLEERRREQVAREKGELKAALRYDRRYKKEHATELKAVVKAYGYEIRPLLSVKEFFDEGIAMSHCVFACRYYEKPQSVILTIRKGGKRVETCEISKPRREIIQLYGPHDTTPKCQWKVKKAVMAAMPYILKGKEAVING